MEIGMTKEVEAIDPALVARMVAHLRECAEVHGIRPKDPDSQRRYDEMKAIVAALPKPIDPDLLEARRIVIERTRDWGPWQEDIAAGLHDSGVNVSLALAAIKRGRELAQVSA